MLLNNNWHATHIGLGYPPFLPWEKDGQFTLHCYCPSETLHAAYYYTAKRYFQAMP